MSDKEIEKLAMKEWIKLHPDSAARYWPQREGDRKMVWEYFLKAFQIILGKENAVDETKQEG